MGDEEEERAGVRYRSMVYAYGHFVWATKRRYPWLEGDRERAIHRAIVREAQKLRCVVLAIGGMPDHVHLAVRLPGALSPAQLMKQVKGVSSTVMNDLRPEFSEPFHWQDGYAFFSLGQSEGERQAVIAYVRNQKRHHATGDLWPDWEETREGVEEVPVRDKRGETPRFPEG